MLVCNVSQLRRRAAITAGVTEAASALDAPGTGNVVFATLVDDPASVRERVDAFLGQIMLEAATATATVNAGLAYAATIAEVVTAADIASATVTSTVLAISGTPVTTGTEYEHGVGSAYAGFTVTATGGTTPYTFSILSGALPAGITLNGSTGAVSGTPAFESAGTYAGIVIRATDNVGATADLASFTISIAFNDPYYSNVNFLLDYDEVNNNTVFVEQKSGGTMQTFTGAKHSTTVTPLYGTSTFQFDGSNGKIRFSDDPRWNLAASSFTIDFTARPTNITGYHFWIGQWEAAPNLGWVFYQLDNTVGFNLSTTGTDNITQVQSAAASLAINTWARWRIDYNGTKYRLYKNGVMVASSVATRTIFNSNLNLNIGASNLVSFFFAGNCRGIRLTLGTARTNSDSGYTISNRAFPSLRDSVVETATATDLFLGSGGSGGGGSAPTSFNGVSSNVTLSNGNLTVTHSNTSAAGAASGSFDGPAVGRLGLKYYFEVTLSVSVSNGNSIGFVTPTGSVTNNPSVSGGAADKTGISLGSSSSIVYSPNGINTGIDLGPAAVGNVFGVAIDFDNMLIWFRKNGGLWNGSSSANPATGAGGVFASVRSPYAPNLTFAGGANATDVMTGNFGQVAYAGTPPSGFTNWTS